MKFVFNDSLTATLQNDDQQVTTGNIVTSGIILEKKVVTSGTINNLDELIAAYQKLTSEGERVKLLRSTDAQAIFKDPANVAAFAQKAGGSGGGGGRVNAGDSPVAMVNEMIMEGADQSGKPAEKFAPFLSQKDQIIARLKPFMSDNEIGEIFYKFSEKLKLPFTETIGVLEYCIQQSRTCNAKVGDLINFYIDHYGQKRQSANAKRIIETACQYQKLNPTVDIFSVLRDAVHGNQPKVGVGYLSKDPDAQLVFNNLIMLSQASLPEQDEEIRRRFQASRDALNNQEQKVNMQRAIYDMMRTEEMNLQLERLIESLGQGFKFLITQPMYRALRDMFYDINAGKILLNQAGSIFGGDTTPDTKRTTYQEQQTEREEAFPQLPDSRKPFSNNQYNFVKLASPEITRHIYAQTAPVVQKDSTKVTPAQQKQATGALEQIKKSVSDAFGKVTASFNDVFSKIAASAKKVFGNFVTRVMDIFRAIQKAIEELMAAVANKTISMEKISTAFQGVMNALSGTQSGTTSSTTSALSVLGAGVVPGAAPAGIAAQAGAAIIKPNSGTQPVKPPTKSANPPKKANKSQSFNKLAQKSPQQPGAVYAGGNKALEITYKITGWVFMIGSIIVGFINGPALVSGMLEAGFWEDVVNGIGPLIVYIEKALVQLFMDTGLVGGNAPNSTVFFDNNGNPTAIGLQIMANNKETMIALGIADEDAMALSKFSIQKEYFMQQLRTKESNLQNAESQAVQTGNPKSPETTVGSLPVEFQTKLKDFLDFTEKLEVQFKAAINIFRNAINANQKNYNDVQKVQATGKLAEFERDLIEVQSKKSEWSSMKNIAAHMMRKRILLQKLKPLQTQLDTLKKLGIPLANAIATPNGILAQVGRIRNEEQQALNILRKEYSEKIQLLKNPDKTAPLTKYPTDTGVVKLPENPDQKDSKQSPFNAPEDSQFATKPSSNTDKPGESTLRKLPGVK